LFETLGGVFNIPYRRCFAFHVVTVVQAMSIRVDPGEPGRLPLNLNILLGIGGNYPEYFFSKKKRITHNALLIRWEMRIQECRVTDLFKTLRRYFQGYAGGTPPKKITFFVDYVGGIAPGGFTLAVHMHLVGLDLRLQSPEKSAGNQGS
jgi:hypothetical protein